MKVKEWLKNNYKNFHDTEELITRCMKDTGKKSRRNILKELQSLGIIAKKAKNNADSTPIELSLRSKAAQLENALRRVKSESGAIENLFAEVRDSIIAIEPLKPFAIDLKNTKVSSPISACMIVSDWHLGEVIFGGQTYQLNEFNSLIAKRRVTHLIEKYSEWTALHKTNYNIDELVIIVLGDLISGDLHYELTASNEFPVPKQVVKAAHLLTYLVSSLAPQFKKVRVEFNCVDNHSRLTKKLQFKNAAENSYNYIIGEMSKAQLEKHDNVQFNIYNDIKTLIEVKKHKYLIGHGSHFCKPWMGVPFYGIKRMIGEEAKFRMTTPDLGFHKVIMGHYHVPANLSDSIMNGSLSGTSEFDIGCGRFAKPCQVGFFVHPKIGDFDYSTFWLDNA